MWKPQPHQEENARRLLAALKQYGAGLDASDTGTGKTATAVWLCKLLGARPGIVTRKAVISGWQECCQGFGVDPLFIASYEAAKQESFPYAGWSLVRTQHKGTPEEKKIWRHTWRPDLGRVILVFDECQECGSMSSDNGKMLMSGASRYKSLLLSATPFASPLQAGPIVTALRATTPSGFYDSWLYHHGCRKGYHGGWEWDENLDVMEVIRQEIADRVVRTRREEIPNFPTSQIDTMMAPECANSELLLPYLDRIAEARVADIERMREQLPPELHEIAERLPLIEDLRQRQEAEIRKLPFIEKEIEIARGKGMSTAIFLNFDTSIEALADRLNTKCIFRGNAGKSGAAREANKRNFVYNHQTEIIVNAAAGGAGLSLHDPATQRPRRVLISPPWSAKVLKQVLGRCNRLGGGWSHQTLVFSECNIERRVHDRVKNRLQAIDTLVDGDLS